MYEDGKRQLLGAPVESTAGGGDDGQAGARTGGGQATTPGAPTGGSGGFGSLPGGTPGGSPGGMPGMPGMPGGPGGNQNPGPTDAYLANQGKPPPDWRDNNFMASGGGGAGGAGGSNSGNLTAWQPGNGPDFQWADNDALNRMNALTKAFNGQGINGGQRGNNKTTQFIPGMNSALGGGMGGMAGMGGLAGAMPNPVYS